MHIRLTRREPGGFEFGIIYGLIAMLALGAVRFLPVTGLMPDCVFRTLTGFPCPTCGSTRSLAHLSHGRLPAAFAMNPLVSLTVITLVVAMIGGILGRLFHWPRIRLVLSVFEADRMRKIGVLLALLNWLYLIFNL